MPPMQRALGRVPVRGAGFALVLLATTAGATGAASIDVGRDAHDAARPAREDAGADAGEASHTTSPPVSDAHLYERAQDVARARWYRAAEQVRRWERAVMERIAPRIRMWERIAQCETGGNWRDGGRFGGGLGIYVGTWQAYGGTEFAPRPQDATKEQQIAVAERIARDGLGGWGCAHTLGLVG